jgi:Flp pilus assembly protein TadG
MQRILELLKRFRSDERGAFLVLFGVLAIVLVATSGAVVDYTSIEQARTRAQVALDAAALGLQPEIYATGAVASIKTKAQNLLVQQLNTSAAESWSICAEQAIPPCAEIDDVIIDTTQGTLHLEARLKIPTAFVALIGFPSLDARLMAESTRGSVDVEVAVALDITGSMKGQKIEDLKTATKDLIDIVVQDLQKPTYSRVALVPYSMAVNVGSHAADVRGPITAGKAITSAAWASGTAKAISGAAWKVSGTDRSISAITKASPASVTTSGNHGYSDGQTVYISGANGMTEINDRAYVITVTNNRRFTLDGVNSSGYGTYSGGSGTASRCQVTTCDVVITSSSHGFANGDSVYVTGIAGLTQLNNKVFTVANKVANSFELADTSGTPGTYSSSSDTATKCQVLLTCEVLVTSSGHGLSNGDIVYITGVNGMTQLNNKVFAVSNSTANTFSLVQTGPLHGTYASYTSGGTAYCTAAGCEYYYFQNASSGWKLFQVSTCATERTTNAWNDEAPSTTHLGRNYSGSNNPCPTPTITPLTSSKDNLKAAVDELTDGGSTAGHLGLAWAWYMLAPNFAYLWPDAENKPAAYTTPNLMKVLILMTDGEFNTVYCNGVISKDSTSGSGGAADHINCNAPNGSGWTQATKQCDAIKAAGIELYTVGFDIADNQTLQELMASCATSAAHAHLASDGAALKAAFQEIAQNISALRLSR